MVDRILNGHKYTFYDNIEDLPIVQFHRYSKYLLVEGGIGDSISDIDSHISRILEFMKVDVAKASQEVLNLRQCLYVVANEQDFHYKSILCLLKSIDDVPISDFSESGIDNLYEKIKEESKKTIDELVGKLRTSIDSNLVQYFPRLFDSAKEKAYCDLLRKRALLQSDTILNGRDHTQEIEKVNKEIYKNITPKNFEGSESEEVKFDKDFENMCLAMAKEFGGGVKNYTTMEFYSAYERLSKEYEETKKRLKKRR